MSNQSGDAVADDKRAVAVPAVKGLGASERIARNEDVVSEAFRSRVLPKRQAFARFGAARQIRYRVRLQA
jgi:hypothetical protein